MKKLLVSVVFFALAGTAFAADMVPADDPLVINADQTTPPEPVADRWAGPYVGIALGRGYLKDSAPAEGEDTIYGAFAGYNLQWGPIVLGVEATADKTDIVFNDGSAIASKYMYGARLRGGLANEYVFAYGSIGAQHGVTNKIPAFGLVSPFNEDTALQLGAGLDVAVTKNIALGADFTYTKYKEFGDFRFFGQTVDVETKKLMLRLSYRFN
jgi:outer membrane immunogenic protein